MAKVWIFAIFATGGAFGDQAEFRGVFSTKEKALKVAKKYEKHYGLTLDYKTKGRDMVDLIQGKDTVGQVFELSVDREQSIVF